MVIMCLSWSCARLFVFDVSKILNDPLDRFECNCVHLQLIAFWSQPNPKWLLQLNELRKQKHGHNSMFTDTELIVAKKCPQPELETQQIAHHPCLRLLSLQLHQPCLSLRQEFI